MRIALIRIVPSDERHGSISLTFLVTMLIGRQPQLSPDNLTQLASFA
jgi:hypothetical protein